MITAKEANSSIFKSFEDLILSEIEEIIRDNIDVTHDKYAIVPFPISMVPSKGKVLSEGDHFDKIILELMKNGYSIAIEDPSCITCTNLCNVTNIPKSLRDFIPEDQIQIIGESTNAAKIYNIVISWEDTSKVVLIDKRTANE